MSVLLPPYSSLFLLTVMEVSVTAVSSTPIDGEGLGTLRFYDVKSDFENRNETIISVQDKLITHQYCCSPLSIPSNNSFYRNDSPRVLTVISN